MSTVKSVLKRIISRIGITVLKHKVCCVQTAVQTFALGRSALFCALFYTIASIFYSLIFHLYFIISLITLLIELIKQADAHLHIPFDVHTLSLRIASPNVYSSKPHFRFTLLKLLLALTFRTYTIITKLLIIEYC